MPSVKLPDVVSVFLIRFLNDVISIFFILSEGTELLKQYYKCIMVFCDMLWSTDIRRACNWGSSVDVV